MEVILWIIGGLFVFGLLKALGVIQEILYLIAACLLIGGVAALISWICDWDSGLWFKVGVWGGAGLYALMCISRIINPTITIIYTNDGRTEEHNERFNGIVGIIVLIIAVIISLS